MSVAVRVLCSGTAQSDGESNTSPRAARGNGLTLRGRTAQIINGKLVMVDTVRNSDEQELEIPSDGTTAAQAKEISVASTSRASTPSASNKVSSSRPKLPRRQTRYFCTWEGCLKSYAKPVRLEEHFRSHTGERPYKCTHEGCGASYLRDTHLVAHMRTHLDDKDKPFTCDVDECGKRFWTNQHLNRHVKLVHEQNSAAYKCEQCDAAFNKHNKLREHIVKDHMPEGTKPFFCPVQGCGKSFQTSSSLRTHSKLHDENRYVCMHPSHLAQDHKDLTVNHLDAVEDEDEPSQTVFPHFATWSALQEHNKVEHPPICPHADCRGRTFRSNKKLRKHCIKFHLDTLPQSEEESATAEEGDLTADEQGDKFRDIETKNTQPFVASHPPICNIDSEVFYGDAEASLDEATGSSDSVRPQIIGGNHKRKTTGSVHPQLISTQPAAFQAFDGIYDYAEEAQHEAEGEDFGLEVSTNNKRVRFA